MRIFKAAWISLSLMSLAACSVAEKNSVKQTTQNLKPSAPVSMKSTRLDPPAGYVVNKNKVIMMGMIHRGHVDSERYGLNVVEQLIRNIDPDYVLTEIPPDRLADAVHGFAQTGEVIEPRVKVFPEYRDVLFPLTKEMDFKIIPTAAWSRRMADYRREALSRIQDDVSRKKTGMPTHLLMQQDVRLSGNEVMTRVLFIQMNMTR